jgi:glucokinase
MKKKLILGIDIGATNTKLGIVSQKGEILESSSFKTESKKGFDFFLQNLKSACAKLTLNYSVSAVGVGAPDYNVVSGNIENGTNLAWKCAPLRGELEKIFDCPVYLHNDANIAAVGEKKFGAAQGVDDFIVVTIGTGIGTGAFVQGRLLTGKSGMACEAGHLVVEVDGRPCGCGAKGHLEAYASVTAIKESVRKALGHDLSFSEIINRYQADDGPIEAIVKSAAQFLGVGLAQMQSILLPELIILAGGGSNLGLKYKKEVERAFMSAAFKPFQNKTQLKLSEISAKHGAIIGAAALGLEGLGSIDY